MLADLQELSELIDSVEVLQASLDSAELRGIVLGKVMEQVVDRPGFPDGVAGLPEVREIAEVALNEHFDELKLKLQPVEENMRGVLRRLAESVSATESDR